jgi:glycogen(starch) synthase
LEKKKIGESSNPDFVFEVSWEVCNKVGGIHTVLKSKIPQMIKENGERYCLVGPYFHDRVRGEFEELIMPDEYREGAEELRSWGIVPHYGKWLTEGNPQTLLLDFQPFFAQKDNIKRELWEKFKIDSLNSQFEFDEPVVWAWAVGVAMENFFRKYLSSSRSVGIFHEWLAGAGLLYLKSRKIRIGTVFITHATVLGRSMANHGVDIYSHDSNGKCVLERMDIGKEAYNYQVHSKHQLEKACANTADVFATVSEMTGIEAGIVLGRKPDILVPNGLEINNFPSLEESMIRHRMLRDKIYHFLLYYFFPYYHVDIEETLIYFTACRYEIHDKGLDIIAQALCLLNERLKKEGSDRNIVVFFWVPTGVRAIKSELLENKLMFKDIEDSLKDNAEHVMWRLLSTIVADKEITKDAIFTKEFLTEVKSKLLRFKRESSSPPLCTHDLADPNDSVMRIIGECKLRNSKDDRVKVIFYPTYLTGADGLLDLTYYEALQGSHLGIFPSFYEPWGYTPLETGALAVPSITSDLAGFGNHLIRQDIYKQLGIRVLQRMDRSDEESVRELSEMLYMYSTFSRKKRVECKLEARNLANAYDWEVLAANYHDAADMAIKRAFGTGN